MDSTQNASQLLSGNTVDPAVLSGPAPTSPTTPPTLPSPQNGQPAPNPAAVAKVSRLAGLGHMVEQLFTGKETQYAVDPATGKTVATQVPEAPGSIFRHILGGAIVGGAAATARPNPNAGIGGGMATGGAAVVHQNEAEDQLKRENAQTEFQDESAVRAQKEREISQQAQLTQWGLTNLRADRELNMHTQEFIQNLNFHNQEAEKEVVKGGGVPANLFVGGQDINGIKGNYKQLRTALAANPSLMRGPTGQGRIWTMAVDYSGLTSKADGEWTDKTGNSIDLADRTTWTAFDVPLKTLDQNIQVSGSKLNKFGFDFEPDKTYTLTMQNYLALQTHVLAEKVKAGEEKIRQDHEDARERYRQKQENDRQARSLAAKGNTQAKIGDIVTVGGMALRFESK